MVSPCKRENSFTEKTNARTFSNVNSSIHNKIQNLNIFFSGPLKGHVTELCAAIEQDTTELTHLCREGRGSSARAMALSKKIAGNLENLKHAIETAIVDKVIDDFLDIGSPLAKFTEVVLTPKEGDVNRQYEEKANQLGQFSDRIVRTSKMVAVGTGNANKKAAEGILTVAGQVESLTPQLINAGRIRMVSVQLFGKKIFKTQKTREIK